MNATVDLVPPPAVVRERLAQNHREGKLLRALYRLSVRFQPTVAHSGQSSASPNASVVKPAGQGVASC